MRITTFTAKNYRSITTAYKLKLGPYSVLVGPNNEGKSNVLKAVVTALTLLTKGKVLAQTGNRRLRYDYRAIEDGRFDYQWERDYPVDLQAGDASGGSEFEVEFGLDERELCEFRAEVGSNLKSALRIRLTLTEGDAVFDVVIRGPGKKAMTRKMGKIAAFISRRLTIEYIPAIRPAEFSTNIVRRLLTTELSGVADAEEYKQLQKQLVALEPPILDRVAADLENTIKQFIPHVTGVRLEQREVSGYSMARDIGVHIDDGVDTHLSLKGDGVKSLVAIALSRHLVQSGIGNQSLIFALEEPESHLHPGAVHTLRGVLRDIADTQQTIITTHSSVLIDREKPESNIIVERGTAAPARGLRDVRRSLGIELSDNLTGAHLVLLVEGGTDKRIVTTWMRGLSPKLRHALNEGMLVIEPMGRASHLRTRVDTYRRMICNVHALLDNDDAGRKAVKQAEGVLKPVDYHVAALEGMPRDSEIEDFVVADVYREAFRVTYGIDLTAAGDFRAKHRKWSDRTAKVAKNAGKVVDEDLLAEWKVLVAKKAESVGLASLRSEGRPLFQVIAEALERRLQR